MYLLELAKLDDVRKCYNIIKEAKNFKRSRDLLNGRMIIPIKIRFNRIYKRKKGYIVTSDKEIAGYMCIDFSGEPAYENIEGKWNTDLPYAVIHRMAFSKEFRNRGLSSIALSLIENLCLSKNIKSIRVDTDFPNKRMQHILEKTAFLNVG